MVLLRSVPKPNRATHTTQNGTLGFHLTQHSVFVTNLPLNLTKFKIVGAPGLKKCLFLTRRILQDRKIVFQLFANGPQSKCLLLQLHLQGMQNEAPQPHTSRHNFAGEFI